MALTVNFVIATSRDMPMPFNLENFKNQPPIAVIKDEDISGLSLFKKRLEQLFFANVVIRNRNCDRNTAKLIIEVSCNFTLGSGIVHLESGIWAQLRKSSDTTVATSEFYNLVVQLQEQNSFSIVVEEFSIIFNNCNVIINQIYDSSIPEQLDTILTKIADHYTGLTVGMQETPYEIFIPVFEEDSTPDITTAPRVPNVPTSQERIPNYFNYWGLYFNSNDEAQIYNFEEKVIIEGELNMLNE